MSQQKTQITSVGVIQTASGKKEDNEMTDMKSGCGEDTNHPSDDKNSSRGRFWYRRVEANHRSYNEPNHSCTQTHNHTNTQKSKITAWNTGVVVAAYLPFSSHCTRRISFSEGSKKLQSATFQRQNKIRRNADGWCEAGSSRGVASCGGFRQLRMVPGT